MDYKISRWSETTTNIFQFRDNLHYDSPPKTKAGHENTQFKNLMRNPELYFNYLANVIKNNDEKMIMDELNIFFKITSNKDFFFHISFENSDLPNGLFFLLSNRDSCFLVTILKIIANLAASNYCSSFGKLEPVDSLFSIFKDAPYLNIKSYALTALTNFVGDSIDFRNKFFKHVAYVINIAQDLKINKIIKQNIFLLVLNCSLFKLNKTQYEVIGSAVLSLIDYADDDLTRRIIVKTLEKLSKYSMFFEFFRDTQIPFFLSKSLSSTDSTLIQSTLIIEKIIYNLYEFKNIPDIEIIAKHLHSKCCEVSVAACRALSEIFKKSPSAVSDEKGIKIAKDLVNILHCAKIALKKEAFYCLLCLLYIKNDYMREIVDEKFVLTLYELLSIEEDAMIVNDLKLLNIIFSVEVNDGQHMPLFYLFCGNQGMDVVQELSQSKNREIADLSTSFILKFKDFL